MNYGLLFPVKDCSRPCPGITFFGGIYSFGGAGCSGNMYFSIRPFNLGLKYLQDGLLCFGNANA